MENRLRFVPLPLRLLICITWPCKTRADALRHPVAALWTPPDMTPPVKVYPMPVRLRKFIGTILIVVLVIGYALLATLFASLLLGTAPWWVHLLYFTLTGLLWVLPAMLIIKWMAGAPQK